MERDIECGPEDCSGQYVCRDHEIAGLRADLKKARAAAMEAAYKDCEKYVTMRHGALEGSYIADLYKKALIGKEGK